MQAIRVLYHSPCIDGSFAALAAYLRFKAFHNSLQYDVKYVPHRTFESLSLSNKTLFPSDSEVYLLDYVGPPFFASQLAKQVKKVTVLDHHKTAVEEFDSLRKNNGIPSNLEINMDMEKSGATLSWAYFQKQGIQIEAKKHASLDKIYSYVEDNDLWRKSLPFTKEFSCGFDSLNIQMDYEKNPNLFEQLLNVDFDNVVEIGVGRLNEINKLISEEITKSFQIHLGGPSSSFGKCLAVFCDYGGVRSELGHRLAVMSQEAGLRGIAAVVYHEELMKDDSKVKISLRSVEEEDTTVIAKTYGGGGHMNASGFVIDKEQFLTWKI